MENLNSSGAAAVAVLIDFSNADFQIKCTTEPPFANVLLVLTQQKTKCTRIRCTFAARESSEQLQAINLVRCFLTYHHHHHFR